MAASLTIFAVTYFAVIAPSMNTANQALKSGLQQTQQAVKQAQQQLSSDSGQASAASAAAGQAQPQLASDSGQASPAAGQAQQALSTAAKLTKCVAAAGTDPTKLEACQAK